MKMILSDDEVGRLDIALAALRDTARLAVLTPLSWHLRQRDTRRALVLADEAEALLMHPGVPDAERRRITARLQLVRSEAKWLYADMDAAEALAYAALQTFTALGDRIGCMDTHLLLGLIANDRGNASHRDTELEAVSAAARRHGETLRADVAEAGLAFFAVFRDPRAEMRWRHRINPLSLNDHPAVVAWADAFRGMSAFWSSDFGRAIACGILAHDAALASGQIRLAISTATYVGFAFSNLNDHNGSLKWMQRALDLARPTGWAMSIGLCLTQTVAILRLLGRREAAQELIGEASATLASFPDSYNYSFVLQYHGDLALDRGDYAAALDIFLQLSKRADTLSQSLFQIESWRGRAHALSYLARPSEALKTAQAALTLAQSRGDTRRRITVLQLLADIHARHALPVPIDMTAASAALHYLQQALDVAATIDSFTIPGDLLDAVAREYAKAGDHAQAYSIALRAGAARDKTHSQQANNRAIALEIRHQTERIRAEGEHHRQLAASEAKRAETLQQTGAMLVHLSAIGQDITARLNTVAVFEALDRHVDGLLDATGFAIYLLDLDRMHLTQAFGIEAGQRLASVRFALCNPVSHAARCARERREIMIDQAADSGDLYRMPDALPMLSMLFAPLMIGERVLGVMTVQSPTRHAYGEREQLILRTLCAYGAIALDNAAAYRQLEETLQILNRTQAELLVKNRALAHANRMQEKHQSELTRFLAVASHDLRQPMHAMNLYLGALTASDLPESARSILGNVNQCARIMDEMFLALLDLSRLDAQVVQPHIERFSIALVLSRLAVEFAPQAHAKGIAFHIESSAAWVDSDLSLVERILGNLVANAVRYTDAGAIAITCSSAGGTLRVAVQDTGIGISLHQQETVFEEFCQIGNAGRDRTKGLGLGLAIVQRLGRLLNTPITLVSALGQGSTFAIDLPLAANQIGEATPIMAHAAGHETLRSALIVVVDDEESILDGMRILLEQWGCTVVTAASANEAIVKLGAGDRLPDALICDYRLRLNETGVDAIRALQDEFNQEIPALLVTGDIAPQRIQETLSSGLPVLHKPVQAGALRSALYQLLEDR